MHLLAKQRDILKDAYSRVKIEKEDPEYDTYVGSLGQIVNSQVKDLLTSFTEHEKLFNERTRIYHHYMKDQQSEVLDQFRTDVLQHLAGSIVIKEHRIRYQKEQYDRLV